ncbi:MAG TPA: PEP-utilizing enzyme [Thermomicrobiales bacterium]|nr:PEP-utilizing enzyme [Thermomicrobiales bacterium]
MSMTTPTAVPAPMTPAWEQPEDAKLFWRQDRMHFPYPITRMEDDLAQYGLAAGMNLAHELYDIPNRLQARRFWTYNYGSMAPLPLTPEEMQAMAARSEQKMRTIIGRLDEEWRSVWLPAIQQHLEHFRDFDLSGASDAALMEHFENAIERIRALWQLHFEIVVPAYLAMNLFDELYRELFSDASAFRPYQLLQGLPNKTVESGNALWRLSRMAAGSTVIRDIFVLYPPRDVVPALESIPEGQDFLIQFHAFLQEFGKRGESWGLSYPTWIEDPTPVVKTIRDYLNNPAHNPIRDQRELAEEREQLIADSRSVLASYPEAVRGQFEGLLAAAQAGVVLSEDHGYWIDFQGMYEVRRLFMEIGRRFAAAKVLTAAENIFHLSFDEIRDTARYLPRVDRRALVAVRRAEMEHYRSITPPPAVGTPPPDMQEGNDNPGARTASKFFGGPPPVSDDPDVLFGAAGSAGVVRGRARVIHDIADAARLQPGEIMVTATTAPPWTPLFGTAVAVVTDTGGVLSHCAVVAREYRIPAVVGTGFATTAITDGQIIEVDGERGVVRIIRGA